MRSDSHLISRFEKFVQAPDFPCVGAKSALARQRMRFIVARDISSGWDDARLYPELFFLSQRWADDPKIFQSLIVLFEGGPEFLSEPEFERHLWARLQSISDKDAWRGVGYDPEVRRDPDDPHFSFSVGGEAFFVVGLHPNASRPARRFERPALVFNIRKQFEALRAEGRYEKLRENILDRDVALAGSLNPMIARHGESSEARQYSGRAVDDAWQCPFHSKHKDTADAD